MRFTINELEPLRLQYLLQSVVTSRPVGLVSTIDKAGVPNLAPFSFFGLFSIQPPVLIFSPSRRMRDGSVKHTLNNLHDVPECVIHLVEYEQAGQMNLCAFEYEPEVNEFEKAGFTMNPASVVKPFIVEECRVKLECKVISIQSLGDNGGAGNLVTCDIVAMHIDETLMNDQLTFDAAAFRPIARLGGDGYTRVEPSNCFTLEKPGSREAVGVGILPDFIKKKAGLTINQLARLASVAEIPFEDEGFRDERLAAINHFLRNAERENSIFQYAAELLESGHVKQAWQVLLQCQRVVHAVLPGSKLYDDQQENINAG